MSMNMNMNMNMNGRLLLLIMLNLCLIVAARGVSFDDNFSVIWGRPEVQLVNNGERVKLKLDQHSGSGFVSLNDYLYGSFSASIKLPSGNTAGVVLAFYTSNGDRYPDNHDELDFEFLGNLPGKEWAMQTNIYGNGSQARGREERLNFWFDPTLGYHNYTILWSPIHILFMVDNIPIRRMVRTQKLGGDYPSKPMAIYATMWDGSSWATEGGKYPVDYKSRSTPFIATFTNLRLQGCPINPLIDEDYYADNNNNNGDISNFHSQCQGGYVFDEDEEDQEKGMWALKPQQVSSMKWARKNYMYYSYCDDGKRYPFPLPECSDNNSLVSRASRKAVQHHRRRHSRNAKMRPSSSSLSKQEVVDEFP